MTTATTDLKPARTPRAKRVKPGINAPLTFETYLAGAAEMARYDIIDGWKVYYKWGIKELPSPTRDHQEVLQNIFDQVRAFQRASGAGRTIVAPCDVLIRRQPLQIRQPDLLFIENDRWSKNPPSNIPGALDPAPELVVEIVYPFDHASMLVAKVADYRAVSAREIWIVRPEEHSVQVVALSPREIAPVATYTAGESVVSLAFPGLTADVTDIFEE